MGLLKLEHAIVLAPVLQEWYEQAISVFVIDKERVLVTSFHPDLDIGVRQGDSMEQYKQSGAYKAFHSGERVVVKVNDQTRFKIPYVSIAAPIRDEGLIVGAMSVVISTEQFDSLVLMGEQLLVGTESVFASAQNISADSEEVAANAKSMDNATGQIRRNIEHMAEVIKGIKQISAKSKILGINASIEAARAGEHGRGFKIVAEEVRKLADTTNTASTVIESDIQRIMETINIFIVSINQQSIISEQQAVEIAELTASLNNISNLAQNLVSIGRNSRN
ncbi:MAG: chemotaxis protein [Desulfosporosinus sp. BRH_c37]|nr:MAG: chemotaxis protein [Desulfosporosinus sp. BRH_c37]